MQLGIVVGPGALELHHASTTAEHVVDIAERDHALGDSLEVEVAVVVFLEGPSNPHGESQLILAYPSKPQLIPANPT